ncbi:efflux RND transporter periplasmic adaptor subunit [Rhodoplanes sp. Z2-YC6860]|uniref:efflux RND transporter periplasmic adaptor subunit n=1 Tax=Rhodoplanes sp. Z2-YC6860 TaxID=674703 RepID=UPI00078D8842|nr:efflux RND transporter periplasmic adaptor subunit [Rhodoplanes sp. Z2-YC6860]AMN45257.1 RND family efflux transporter, MFP subunit [Rhodoplanes sp. Z2-YC6860]
MTPFRAVRLSSMAALASLALAACSEGPAAPSDKAPPQEVSVVALEPTPRPVIRELPGRIAPTRIAEVRARVSGIVVSRNFEQGTDVKEGDVLYELDAKPFEIDLQAQQAALDRATAVLQQEGQNAKRAQALLPSRAIAQAQYDTAIATLRQAEADVAARQADVARARLNLDYTKVRAPISGRIGRALVTEGALINSADATNMATIQRLDPIYADFTQSVAELNQLRREFARGDLEEVAPGAAKVRLVLDNGELYPYHGRLLFSEATVDPGTGQVTLRGEFPNPKMELLPGTYVRVQIEQGIDPDALSVPQQAVRRNDAGGSELFLVRDDNRATMAPVRLGRVVDNQWLVLDGVKPGDRVIVDGFQKFVAGDVINPKPWQAAVTRRAETEAPRREANADENISTR